MDRTFQGAKNTHTLFSKIVHITGVPTKVKQAENKSELDVLYEF